MATNVLLLALITVGNFVAQAQQPACLVTGRFNCLFDIPAEDRTRQKCQQVAPRCRYCQERGKPRVCQIHNRACIVPDHVVVPGNLNQEQCETQGHVYCWGDVEHKCVYSEPVRSICLKKFAPNPCSDATATTELACHRAGCVWCGEGARSTTINQCFALPASATCNGGGNCCRAITCSTVLAKCEFKGCRICNDGGTSRCVYRVQTVQPPPPTNLPTCQTGNVEDCFAAISIIPTQQLCEDLCCTWCVDDGAVVCRRENFPATCEAQINIMCPTRNLDSCPDCKSHGCEWCGGGSNLLECQASTTCTTCNCPNTVECCAGTETACGAKGCLWCDQMTSTRSFHCMNLDSDGVLPTNPTAFVKCTRSCGSGTKWRYTECEAANPLSCPREYVTCNTQPCAINICPEGELIRADLTGSCCMNHTTVCGRNTLNEVRPPPPAGGRKKRVVGGSDSGTVEKWPWLVRLRFNETDSCSGTLVSDEYVITSTCCVEQLEAADLTVYLETYSLETAPGRERGASAVSISGDVAIIKLNASVEPFSTGVHPLCMPKGEIPTVDTHCFVAGWGLTDPTNHTSFAQTIHDVAVRISSWTLCEESWGDSIIGLDPQRHFCAGVPEGVKDACTGDKGSPLMCQRCANCGWYLAGVATGNLGCGVAAKPTLYAKVGFYDAWASTIFAPLESETYSGFC